jgi:cyclic-di-GMP phosphodiesterase TipF (flagellum assembly factor)
VVSANSTGADRIQAVVGEINELGTLVKQLAASVASHDDMLTAGVVAAAPPGPPDHDPPKGLESQKGPEPAKGLSFAAEDQSVAATTAAPAVVAAKPATSRSEAQILAAVKAAVEENRIDIYLQPMVTLPQRKVRFYEAVTRLRDDNDEIITADDFVGIAEAAGLIGRIDHMVMLRCVQVLRRLMVRNKDVGVFCNVAAATLGNPATFAQCLDFLEANRALAPSFVLEFKQATFRGLGPTETEHLAALAQRGYRFSIDHVTDLRIEPRELADRGVRFIKVPATLLLDPRQTSTSDIHPSDLSDLLGRFGIDLIAERIEGERAVVDLLDYDVRFGQGFLFAPPRPLRPEGASATGGASANKAQESTGSSSGLSNGASNGPSNGSGKAVPVEPPAVEPTRTGNAALARRVGGPG